MIIVRAVRAAFFGLSCVLFTALMPQTSQAVTLNIDTYLQGDVNIIPFLPLGSIEITDVGPDLVQFSVSPIPNVKYVNLGLGLDSSVNENQLVLTSLSGDRMELDTGGWLGYPFKIEFLDRPITPVAFTLMAPSLDVSDFLVTPASSKFPNNNFALQIWYFVNGDMVDSTVGNNTQIPEPGTLILLGSGVVGLLARRRSSL